MSIVEGIPRQIALSRCRGCSRYNKPPWTSCEAESRELLGICLTKIKGVNKDVRLVDANFIWTEEHSKRIKVKLTVQKEVANATVLQQTVVVEFQVVNQQCEDCARSYTPHLSNAIVQLRQKVEHRRTFCYLEQLILKHDMHEKVLKLEESREGLDFHFSHQSHAQRFADFVQSCAPAAVKTSKHLVSHDANSNKYHYKYTFMTELCPICTDDLVHVPKGHSQALSGCLPVMLCYKISTAIHLVNPVTLRGYAIPAAEYWKRPIQSVGVRRHLTEFVVMNVEMVDAPQTGSEAKHHLAGRQKFHLADVELMRASDFGQNDNRMVIRSHLGHILKPGNHVLGYDLKAINLSGIDTEAMDDYPTDVILVKKQFKRKHRRNWGLQRLERDGAVDDEADIEAIQQDLEEDPEMRKNVNLFRDQNTAPAPEDVPVEDSDDDAPEVPLTELLEGLTLA